MFGASQIHPRPRQEAAAAAAAMAEAQQIAAQMAAQAMAMDPSQAYMQQGRDTEGVDSSGTALINSCSCAPQWLLIR